ncbi:MAG: ATP-dependent DNA helicase RecG, partial [Armatimonadetes bacterium]|nr:ATP-dependent DNA helicase RecG [Armatimonadota bacterium]
HEAPHGETRTFRVRVIRLNEPRLRTGRRLTEVHFTDGTALGVAKFWGARYLQRAVAPDAELVLWGRVRRNGGKLEIENAEFEAIGKDTDESLHTGRIVPVHPAGEGISPRVLRRVVHAAVTRYADQAPETLPEELRRRCDLMGAAAALRAIHFPSDLAEVEAARRRLAFEELLALQIALLLRRRAAVRDRKPHRYTEEGGLVDAFLASLPFALTGAQRRVIAEVRREMTSPYPMNRLLQGDVGSGKTVVAASATVLCVQSGLQAAWMAPTEILADQHYLNLRRLLEPRGIHVVSLASGLRRSERRERLDAIARGEAELVVGTHALLQEDVFFHRLGFAVVDEQHKFGVAQRAALRAKGHAPDVLVMTATPIPRTLALTLYGDLEVSVLDELPPGRTPVRTFLRSPLQRSPVYDFLRKEIEAGRQGYVVCPLVEESDKLQANAATQLRDQLAGGALPGLEIGLLHGRQSVDEKDQVMSAFRRGELPVIVATTVIEVGIDVPNATVMIIEDAERFGLAQLHQLRGRVGRGAASSYCILLSSATSEDAQTRLRAMVETNDGFAIAESDLVLRGPGDFFGTRQSGVLDLRVADLLRDAQLLEIARSEADRLLAADPGLRGREHGGLRGSLLRRFEDSAALLAVG